MTWRSFLGHYAGQMLGCDFFTVETIRFQTLYVLFFIELGTRRVYLAGCTAHATLKWVTQQARNLTWDIGDLRDVENRDSELPIRFLIHDRDTKFTSSFDEVFDSEGIERVLTPYRCPKANAYAERWIPSAREECLDWLLIVSEAHLRRVLLEYVSYYNHRRPHQGIDQRIPVPLMPLTQERRIEGARPARRGVLGGVIRDYYWEDRQVA
jgi:putative transposase